MKEIVGVVGLGNMGYGMALNMLKAGYPVVGYDIRPEPGQALAAAGGRAASSPAEVGAVARTVLVMVLSYAQLEEAVLGVGGLAASLGPGGTVIGAATIAPDQARRLGAALGERGLHYLDAPVSGGKVGARAGTLTMMVGAAEDDYAAQRPLLEAMAANIYYCGPVGAGQTAKMCNQVMAGITLVATAECLALGAAAGIDRRLLYDVITHGAGDCWMFRNRGARLIDGDDEVTSRLDIWLKDLGIVLDTADQHHLPLLLATAARQWMAMAAAEGLGAEDDTMVVRLMERFSGAPVRAG